MSAALKVVIYDVFLPVCVSERAFGFCCRGQTSPCRINKLHSGWNVWSVTCKGTQHVNALTVPPQAPGRWSLSSSSASSSFLPFCWSSSRRTTGGAAFLSDVAKFLPSECHSRAIFINTPAVALLNIYLEFKRNFFLPVRPPLSNRCTHSCTNTRPTSWNVS